MVKFSAYSLLRKFWEQHPTKQQLYLFPISKTPKLDEKDMLGTAGEPETNLLARSSGGLLHMDKSVLVD